MFFFPSLSLRTHVRALNAVPQKGTSALCACVYVCVCVAQSFNASYLFICFVYRFIYLEREREREREREWLSIYSLFLFSSFFISISSQKQ